MKFNSSLASRGDKWIVHLSNTDKLCSQIVLVVIPPIYCFCQVKIIFLIIERFGSCFLILIEFSSSSTKNNTGANSTLEPEWQWLCDGWVSAFGSKKNYLCWRSSAAPPSWWVEGKCRACSRGFQIKQKRWEKIYSICKRAGNIPSFPKIVAHFLSQWVSSSLQNMNCEHFLSFK